MITCNHRLAQGRHGLCRACRRDYEEDPSAFDEYGPHPQGEANWKNLQREMDEDARQSATTWDDQDIPF